jgi:hypothetical protein
MSLICCMQASLQEWEDSSEEEAAWPEELNDDMEIEKQAAEERKRHKRIMREKRVQHERESKEKKPATKAPKKLGTKAN